MVKSPTLRGTRQNTGVPLKLGSKLGTTQAQPGHLPDTCSRVMTKDLPHSTAIIILNYNSAAETIRLYASLQPHLRPAVFVLVVDNNSDSSDRAQLTEAIPSESLIRNDANLGYAGGNNIGITLALRRGAEYIWLLNPDIETGFDVLEALVHALHTHSRFAAIMPRIVFRDDPSRIYSDGGTMSPTQGFVVGHANTRANISEALSNPGDDLKEASFANGSCLLLRARALRELGNFRECFFLYWEETEWCLRARDAGWKVGSLTSVSVAHQSSVKGPRYHFYMSRNRIWLAKLRREYVTKTTWAVSLQVLLTAMRVPRRPRRLHAWLARLVGSAQGLLAGIFGHCRE